MTAPHAPTPIAEVQQTAITVHTFTLVFPGGVIAVLCVHGALESHEARAFACGVLPHVAYEVRDGDETRGQAGAFHAWTCAAAQRRRL